MFKTHRTFDLNNGVKSKTIAVFNDDKTISVVYHNTTVFTLKNLKVTIYNGGYDTVSTRLVINQALNSIGCNGFLYRKKNKTYFSLNGVSKEFNGSRKIDLIKTLVNKE